MLTRSILSITMVIMAVAAVLLAFQVTRADETSVVVEIIGPVEVLAGDTVKYQIQADDVTDLAAVQASLIYDPSHFSVESIALDPGFTGCFSFPQIPPGTVVTPGDMGMGLICLADTTGTPLKLWEVTLSVGDVSEPVVTQLATTNVTMGSFDGTDIPARGSTLDVSIVLPDVDLSVTKTDDLDPVIAGTNLTYTVTVTNNSATDTAKGVTLTDTLPGETTFVSATPDQGTCGQAAGVVTCDLGDLAPGQSAQVTIVALVQSGTPVGTISNEAVVAAGNPDPVPGNDTATETTDVDREVDLEVSKSESIDPVVAGSGASNLTYIVTVKNNGPSDASGVTLSEVLTLPGGVSIDSTTPSVGSFAGSTWTLGDLASGSSATLAVVLTVAADAAAGDNVIDDTATVTAVNETDTNAGNDTVFEATSVTREVDLEVTKSESADTVVAGSEAGNLTYVVTVKNNGPSDASGVVLSEDLSLPTGVSVDSTAASVGSFADPDWTVGDLASGSSATLTVVLTVAADAASGANVIDDTAEVTAVNEADTNPGNDSAFEATSVTRNVDLQVTKTESIDPVVAGSGTGNLTYIVTVKNNGPSDASGVTLSEGLILPGGVSIDSTTASSGTFSDPDWTVGDLASGSSATLTVVLTVDDTADIGTNVIDDTAEVTAVNETDTNAGNDTAFEATSVSRNVDLQVTKSESTDTVVAGSGASNLTYVVTVKNNGPSDASGVTLSEVLTLPGGVSIDSTTPSVGSFAGSTWTLGDLASGSSATLTVVLTVAADAAAGDNVIDDTAEVTAVNETDTNAGNDTAFEATSVTRKVDLQVTKTESIDPVVAGSGASNLTYVVTVKNNGPSDASGVTLSEVLTLPGGVSIDSTTASVGSFAASTWNLGDLASGSSATLTVVLTVDSTTATETNVIDDTAEVTAVNETDTNAGNDTAFEATSVTRKVDLQVTKTESIDTVVAGSGTGNLTYIVTVKNNGPSDASDVTLSEVLTLPGGVSIDSTTPSVGSFAGSTWTLGDLASGSSATLTVVLTVAADAAAGDNVIDDTAAVTAVNETDTNPGNDSAFEATSVTREVDLEVTKSDDEDPVLAGGDLSYTVTVSNNGPSDASEVTLTDTLPQGVAFVSATPGSPTCTETGGVVTCGLGDLPAGLSTDVIIVVAIDSSTLGTITNTAQVSGAEEDPEGGNDSASEDTLVAAEADLSIAKSDDPDPVVAGENITYTLTATNNGPSDAPQVTVTDQLPAGATFVSSNTPCTDNSGTVTCDLGPLALGSDASVSIVVKISPSQAEGSTVANTATVSGEVVDPDGTNDTITEDTSVTRTSDLAVTKSDDLDPVVAGTNLSYTVTVSNNGPSDASEVTLTDTLPQGVAFVSATPGSPTCTESGGVVTCGLGVLAAGLSTDVIIVVAIDSSTLGTITNTAQVSGAEEDPEGGNDSASEDTLVAAEADLSIAKSDDPDPVVAGENVTYTLTANNNGPSDAPQVTVTDQLPAGATFVSSDTPCTDNNGTVTCDLGPIALGGDASVSIVVKISPSQAEGSTVSNTATVSGEVMDPDGANDTITEDTSVTRTSDLAVTKSDDLDPVVAGTNLSYTVTVSNNGPSDASAVTLTDTLPQGVAFVSATPGSPTCTESGGVVTCGLGVLAAGQSADVVIVVAVDSSILGTITNTAQVSGAEDDPEGGNDSASEDTLVAAEADLSIAKSDDPDPVESGTNLSYTITAANNGPSDASGVGIVDTLPTDVVFVSANSTQGTCGEAAGIVTCDLGALASGSSAVITVVVTVDVSLADGAVVTNTAQVNGSQDDPDATNNSIIEDTSVIRRADIQITKTVDEQAPKEGETIQYTVTITNNGPKDATGVNVTDALPAGVSFENATVSAGEFDADAGEWSVGSLPNGAEETLVITATVTVGAASLSPITNTAQVSASDPVDPDESNNITAAGITVGADIAVTKTADDEAPVEGAAIQYTVTVVNNGPNDATNVEVTDVLPPGVTFVSATASLGAYDDVTGEWTVGPLANGDSETLVISVTIDDEALDLSPISNTATVSGVGEADPISENDADSVDITVVVVAAGEDNPPPTASITIPPFFANFVTTEIITFIGSATDVPDGNLIGDSLVWTSSIDGSLGTGESIQVVLSAGTHIITLTATDSDGATGSAIRSITVNEPVGTSAGGGGGGGGAPAGGGSPVPTAEPTTVPTAEPIVVPTAEPTTAPTAEPTIAPTAEPTTAPTAEPTTVPTAEPTTVPTAEPTTVPTAEPTAEPTAVPAAEPTALPTAEPTETPGGGAGGAGGDDGDSGLSAGAFVGIIAAVVVGVLAVLSYGLMRRRGRSI